MDTSNPNPNYNLHAVSSNPQFNKIKLITLKKAKSLEALSTVEKKVESQASKVASHELEFMNSRIQQLNVHD